MQSKDRTFVVDTQYPSPTDRFGRWETTANSPKKAIANIRYRVARFTGLAMSAIITTYWTATEGAL